MTTNNFFDNYLCGSMRKQLKQLNNYTQTVAKHD